MGLGVLAIVIIAIVFLLPAQEAEHSAEAASITSRVDKIFEKWDQPNSPGCALAVIKDGRIVYKRGYGIANLDHDVPITPSTVFFVASVTKQFTAAAIALLAQQGKLSLDDEVRKYIPAVPDFGAPITIRHLIHHTSGLRDWLPGAVLPDDVLELVSRQKELNFRPGEKDLYSNMGYRLLGLIVERASDQSLREFARANIFQPLGMEKTHFHDDPGEKVRNLAYGYEPTKADAYRPISITKIPVVGSGALLSTVEDLALWDRNFYDERVGGSALIEQLHQRGRLNNGEHTNYAFGLVISKYRGLPNVYHAGTYRGYYAWLTRFPEQRFSVACLCNAANANPGQLVGKVSDIYLAKELKEPVDEETVHVTEQQLASNVGLYWNRELDGFLEFSMKEGKLHVLWDFRPETDALTTPLSKNRFRVGDYPEDPMEYRFEATTPGERPRLIIHSVRQGYTPEFYYEPVVQFTPTRGELGDYVGTYVSDEVDVIYRVALRDDKLLLKRLAFKPAILVPALRDVVSAPSSTPRWSLRFTRDANNRVSGVVLNNYDNRNFRFTKQTP